MSNFVFLKNNNQDLFNIVKEAECLFRDEYFEQAMVQTRRYAENLCRDILGEKLLTDDNFDSMIRKLNDNSFDNIRMQEFAEDLYFLKKQGNSSAHSSKSAQNGKIALECLERAFEIGIFYSNIKFGYNKKLDKAVFSEEMIMTGKVTNSKNLKETYVKELKQAKSSKIKKSTKTKTSKPKKFVSKRKNNKKNKKINKFWIIIFVLIVILVLFYQW